MRSPVETRKMGCCGVVEGELRVTCGCDEGPGHRKGATGDE